MLAVEVRRYKSSAMHCVLSLPITGPNLRRSGIYIDSPILSHFH